MRSVKRYARAAVWVLVLLLASPRAAYADNCSGLSDCYGQIAAAAAVVAALALLGLLALGALELIAAGEAAAAAASAAITEAAAAEVAAAAAELAAAEVAAAEVAAAGAGAGAGAAAGTAVTPQTAAAIATAVQTAMASANAGTRLEGRVADAIQRAGISLINFNQRFGVAGKIGEIDIETADVIIETTIRGNGKLPQITNLMNNPTMNPGGKPVVLYAPNYSPLAADEIRRAGGYVATNIDSLIDFLRSF